MIGWRAVSLKQAGTVIALCILNSLLTDSSLVNDGWVIVTVNYSLVLNSLIYLSAVRSGVKIREDGMQQ